MQKCPVPLVPPNCKWDNPTATMGCRERHAAPPAPHTSSNERAIRGRPAVRGKRTYGGRPGQRVEEQGTWASRTQKHSEAGYGRPVDRGAWTAKTVKRPRQQPAHPQYANYWAPLTRKRHTVPHSAQSQHTNYWALRTWKRHQQEHRPQRPTESSDPTRHGPATQQRFGAGQGRTKAGFSHKMIQRLKGHLQKYRGGSGSTAADQPQECEGRCWERFLRAAGTGGEGEVAFE